MRPIFFAIRDPLRNLVSPPILAWKAGLSPHGAPSRDHDFELVTPDVRAPLDSWSFWFLALRKEPLTKPAFPVARCRGCRAQCPSACLDAGVNLRQRQL